MKWGTCITFAHTSARKLHLKPAFVRWDANEEAKKTSWKTSSTYYPFLWRERKKEVFNNSVLLIENHFEWKAFLAEQVRGTKFGCLQVLAALQTLRALAEFPFPMHSSVVCIVGWIDEQFTRATLWLCMWGSIVAALSTVYPWLMSFWHETQEGDRLLNCLLRATLDS